MWFSGSVSVVQLVQLLWNKEAPVWMRTGQIVHGVSNSGQMRKLALTH